MASMEFSSKVIIQQLKYIIEEQERELDNWTNEFFSLDEQWADRTYKVRNYVSTN